MSPIEAFMRIEAASGIILLIAAGVAMTWANSPWAESYAHIWETPFSIRFGQWAIEESLHFWINDLLMAIFFLVVGLEIKREIVEGALSNIRRAALPIAAAIGGMLVPAVVFAAFNVGEPGQHGWGVPMATDIAFAVGVLTLLGKRVPAALRILLLALAIIDDIGAILVIAIFYSGSLNPSGLLPIGVGVAATLVLLGIGVRPGFVYVIPALVVWGGMLDLGVHPTIAGVIVGLMAPVKPWFGKEGFVTVAQQALQDFQDKAGKPDLDDHELMEPLGRLHEAGREAISPARRLEIALHPWVAFGIMPLFALANAGVNLGGIEFGMEGGTVLFWGVFLGLAVGKPAGILGVSWLGTRLRLCILPAGVNWRGVFVIGSAGGIGFTMALFIAGLAFPGDTLLGVTKAAVLAGTTVATITTLAAGLLLLPHEQPKIVADITLSDVETKAEYWTGEQVRRESEK